MQEVSLEIIEQLRYREPIFHQADLCDTREKLEAYTAEDFYEISASGKQYSRQYVIDTVEARFRDGTEPDTTGWEVRDFSVKALSDNLFMTHYLLDQGYRQTWRTGIWRRVDGGWQIVFHQGTIVQ